MTYDCKQNSKERKKGENTIRTKCEERDIFEKLLE
jgi:hypothetical protein